MKFRFPAAYDGNVMTALESMQVAALESMQGDSVGIRAGWRRWNPLLDFYVKS